MAGIPHFRTNPEVCASFQPKQPNLIGGFTPLKNMQVSWDDYSQYMEKIEVFQTTNQNLQIELSEHVF